MRSGLGLLALAVAQTVAAEQPEAAKTRGFYLGVGVLQPESAPQLSAQDGRVALAAGLEWRFSRHLAFELNVLDVGQAADMPEVERSRPGTPGVRERENINIDGLSAGLRFIYPYGKLEPYVAGGIGYYGAEVSNWGTLGHLILPNAVAKRRDNGAGSHLALGVDYQFSPRSALRLEYRRLWLEADFGPEFGAPVKIGGGIPLAAYRWIF